MTYWKIISAYSVKCRVQTIILLIAKFWSQRRLLLSNHLTFFQLNNNPLILVWATVSWFQLLRHHQYLVIASIVIIIIIGISIPLYFIYWEFIARD